MFRLGRRSIHQFNLEVLFRSVQCEAEHHHNDAEGEGKNASKRNKHLDRLERIDHEQHPEKDAQYGTDDVETAIAKAWHTQDGA